MKALALTAALLVALSSGGADIKVVVGSPAPDFEGTWVNHPDSSLSELAGRIVFIEVWRTW
jgi:hypothetical protein